VHGCHQLRRRRRRRMRPGLLCGIDRLDEPHRSPGGMRSAASSDRTDDVSITAADGQTTLVAANANHAFEFYSAAPLKRLTYALPNGAQHEGSLELPPPPH